MNIAFAKKTTIRLIAAACISTNSASATVVINFEEREDDVFVDYFGELNIAGLARNPRVRVNLRVTNVDARRADLVLGRGEGSYYRGDILGPSSFGFGGFRRSSPDVRGISFQNVTFAIFIGLSDGEIVLPRGYRSGEDLSGTVHWEESTFDSLGLTSGQYVWSWGTGSDADSIVLNVGAIPEPSAVFSSLLGGIALLRRRR